MFDYSSKSKRILDIHERLMAGEVLNKNSLAEEYGVDPRSIQRDIDEIRAYYADKAAGGAGCLSEIAYDRTEKGFKLTEKNNNALTDSEIFAVLKILLDSRSLSRAEIDIITDKLLDLSLLPSEKKVMKGLIGNEIYNYVEPRHHKRLIDMIWQLGNIVHEQKIIKLQYRKACGGESEALVKPVGVIASEYYFYLIAYIGDADREHTGYPTIYRIDRIKGFKETGERFSLPYKDRFKEGEFRNRIPFMYSGKLQKHTFIYNGSDINAVLDRLPTAEAKQQADGSYLVTVEVYGDKGLNMWLKGQESITPVE